MEVIVPFLTSIWSFDLDIDSEKECSRAYQVQQIIEGVKLSNCGGYQSNNLDLKQFFPEIYEQIKEKLKFISKETEMDLKLGNSWLNINQTKDFNINHVHPGSAISAVLYLKSDKNSGNIVFKNPTLSYLYPINGNNKLFFQTYWLPPVQGKIYFFPAYLEHSVEPNMSDFERISLAMNFSYNKE